MTDFEFEVRRIARVDDWNTRVEHIQSDNIRCCPYLSVGVVYVFH